MNKLRLKSSLIFILIYIMLVNVGAILSEKLAINYLGQILVLLMFAVFLVIYIEKHELTRVVGLSKISFYEVKKNLFYLPLFMIVLANGVFFYDRTIALKDIILSIVYMILVAFLEELLFRGLLFKSIERDRRTKIAILITGLTFGFGHIINLLNGYIVINQIIQIVMATLIGIILSVLFVRTKSIVPGIIFHLFFNTVSILSVNVTVLCDYISASIIILIALIYLLYLIKTMNKIKISNSSKNTNF